jgi:hypothetical protein
MGLACSYQLINFIISPPFHPLAFVVILRTIQHFSFINSEKFAFYEQEGGLPRQQLS